VLPRLGATPLSGGYSSWQVSDDSGNDYQRLRDQRIVHTGLRKLLLSHEGKDDQKIAKLLGITRTSVYKIRKKYHRQPYDHIVEIINDQPRVGRPITFYYQVEANASMIACSEAPKGYAR
jgi:hypothetical protein